MLHKKTKKSPFPKDLRALDKATFQVGKDFEFLTHLAWKPRVLDQFLSDWEKGRRSFPKVEYQSVPDVSLKLAAVRELIASSRRVDHPLTPLIRKTLESYAMAFRMLNSIGKKPFGRLSQQLFGSTIAEIDPTGPVVVRAARQFLRARRRFEKASIIPEQDFCIFPGHVVEKITEEAKKTLPDVDLRIVVDESISSKASAGASRIRVRAKTCFARHDVSQLIQHELLVHTLTLANGRSQPLKFLGVVSPRTNCTQEGLAVFAEFITNAIDVNRLARISARVVAVDMALKGADFIEVFEFFLKQGQDPQESFFSAQRIFRGGNVRGGTCFTKDLVYLKGFLEVHHFFLQALSEEKLFYPFYIFSGRMRHEDMALLEPYYLSGVLKTPRYVPDWLSDRSTLLAFLLSSTVMNSLGMSRIS